METIEQNEVGNKLTYDEIDLMRRYLTVDRYVEIYLAEIYSRKTNVRKQYRTMEKIIKPKIIKPKIIKGLSH